MQTLTEWFDENELNNRELYVERITSSAKANVFTWIAREQNLVLAQSHYGPVKGTYDPLTGDFQPTHIMTADEGRIEHQRGLLTMFNRKLLPPITEVPINNYIVHRLDPGSFYRAILENDVITAVGRGEHMLVMMIHIILRHLIHKVPRYIWGSPDAVKQWIGY